MSIQHKRPYVNEFYHIVSSLNDEQTEIVYNDEPTLYDDKDTRSITLNNEQLAIAFRVLMSSEFDEWIFYKDEHNDCKEQLSYAKDAILEHIKVEETDNKYIESKIEDIIYYSKQSAYAKEQAQIAKQSILDSLGYDAFENACELYSSMYNVRFYEVYNV